MKKTILAFTVVLSTLLVAGCGFNSGGCCGGSDYYTTTYVPAYSSGCCGGCSSGGCW